MEMETKNGMKEDLRRILGLEEFSSEEVFTVYFGCLVAACVIMIVNSFIV